MTQQIVNGQSRFLVISIYFHYLGKTIAQVSLRWLLQKKQVTSVVIGATKLSQLDDNIGASTGWELSEEEVKRE